ncbi:unnamed protein product [Rotaria magnacalcarata]|uniref:Eukaryotic translation initiation factor 3 subunit M n=3 Tax=Rotaria magnacalcarata TaxID=392030 RepID=A0A814Q0N2_9BILA|nr:unnamed protein product [Rotaria magnacalcarata]
MAQAAATNIKRLLLGSKHNSSNGIRSIAVHSNQNRKHSASTPVDRRTVEKIWKKMNRIVKYCQMPKMNLKNSPPYMLDILPDFYQNLSDIIDYYDDRLHVLNDIEYFCIFIRHIYYLCTKTVECFKRAGHHMYDEQSSYRKYFIKLSLYFSHNLTELKSLFINGIYEGERFRLTKQEATDFWKSNFHNRTIVPWEEFKDKLHQVHMIQSYNESLALKNTIDLTDNNYVSIFEFDVFTRLFHPWSTLLTNWKLLAVAHPGYMAFMTYDEVKAILANYIDKPSSYVFRLSCTRLGQWAIGYVTTQSTILQTIPQTKPLIQALIDGERDGYYKYPNGKNIQIDLSSALRPTQSDRIYVSEEQYEIYCGMGSSFESCKICSTNNKDCKIQPCGHLLCQSCLVAWQNQNSSKPLPLCPFCRSEIKGFESIIVNPFHRSSKHNEKDTNPNESDDQESDTNSSAQSLETLSTTHENSNCAPSPSDNRASAAPPVPPRPINMKANGNRIVTVTKSKAAQRSIQHILPPLHNHSGSSVSQRTSSINSRVLSTISLNQSLTDSYNLSPVTQEEIRPVDLHDASSNYLATTSDTTRHSCGPSINTIDDIRSRLISETNFDSERIDAVLILTEGLSRSKQYRMAKSFLKQVKREQLLNQNSTVFNDSSIIIIIVRMKEDIPTTCVAAVFSDVEPNDQLKDIGKFMHDHGGQPELDFSTNDFESKIESIIRELRNVLKETIAEGEMEMFLNSVMSLILLVPEDKINRPILNFSEAIINANLPEKYGPMKLRILTNLIYVVPERGNTDKYRILIDLIKCARNHRCINAVSVGLNQVKKWVKEWKVSTEQVQELYRNMHEAYAATGDSGNALQLLLELLGTYTKETASKARTDAFKCIINSINDPNVFIMDHLLLLEPVKVLEGENIHNLLNIFVSGRLQDYLEFYAKQKGFIESSGVKHDRNITKMRLLTFLQSAENQKEVTFDTIERQMQITADDVESFIIEAVRTKMIRCKIDHLARKVIIDSTVQRTFTKQHWQSLKEKLESWKANLALINTNLTTLTTAQVTAK